VDIANYSVVDSKLDLALDIHRHTLAAGEGDTGPEALDSLDWRYTPFRINALVDATDQLSLPKMRSWVSGWVGVHKESAKHDKPAVAVLCSNAVGHANTYHQHPMPIQYHTQSTTESPKSRPLRQQRSSESYAVKPPQLRNTHTNTSSTVSLHDTAQTGESVHCRSSRHSSSIDALEGRLKEEGRWKAFEEGDATWWTDKEAKSWLGRCGACGV